MARMRGPDVYAIAFHRHALDVVAELRQFFGQRHADVGLHSTCGFNVDQSASKGEDVHLERIDDRDTAVPVSGWKAMPIA